MAIKISLKNIQPKNEITPPGCLSYTTRALVLAALTKQKVKINNPTKSDDSYAMLEILKTLGIDCEETNSSFVINGSIENVKNKEYTLDVKISGRAARSSLAFLCITPGIKTLTCGESFKKRPVKDLVDGLRQLGAEIEYLEKDGYLPVKINSSKLNPGKVKINGEISSQYFSAIMMISPLVGEVEIEVEGQQASKSFIDMTVKIMQDFGVEVVNQDYKRYIIPKNSEYNLKNGEYTVESDATASTYFWAIAALSGGKIKVNNINFSSLQGDVYFAKVMGQMGCRVVEEKDSITVEGVSNLKPVKANMHSAPDSAVTLMTTCAFANGTSQITGLETLLFKECDRIQDPARELAKMGIKADFTNDSITIYGGSPEPATIETYHDHRIAMSFGIMPAKLDCVEINNPDVITKSFPTFWTELKKLGFEITEV